MWKCIVWSGFRTGTAQVQIKELETCEGTLRFEIRAETVGKAILGFDGLEGLGAVCVEESCDLGTEDGRGEDKKVEDVGMRVNVHGATDILESKR